MAVSAPVFTFLFTDIEGSTKLWEQAPQEMALALARHDQILRQSIEMEQGYVFKTVGDAFCAVFHRASDALQAVVRAQHILVMEPWLTPSPIKVRMALHSGAAIERDNDYFGPVLNRVARILAIGHGGQILISGATQQYLEQLPELIHLENLGHHRLKDLLQAEQIWQLCHPHLPHQFPPLKSLNFTLHNLPAQMTSFVGRGREINEIKQLLLTARLVTLTGTGGAGKTRLSLQIGGELLNGDADGVWFVELAPVNEDSLVLQAVANVFKIHEERDQSLQEALLSYLHPKSLLLILDNCEHLVLACAQLVERILQSCPKVKILVSSRETLNIPCEVRYRVPSLSLPEPGIPWTLDQTEKFEALHLFLDRARMALTSFALTEHNASMIVAICRRLDGIPLALELAAARVRTLPIEKIQARLEDQFRLLTGGSRTALPRQQTLRALIDWSYDLLNVKEQLLLQRLSIFSGGWDLCAAETICSDPALENWEILDLLTALVDKSLVFYESETDRYRLLETVKHYAHEKLNAPMFFHQRYCAYYLALAEDADPQLLGLEAKKILAKLELEHDNFRTALTIAQNTLADWELVLRLCVALVYFWRLRGYWSEGKDQLQRALDHSATPNGTRAKALNGLGSITIYQGNYLEAEHLFRLALIISQDCLDPSIEALTLNNLGKVSFSQGNYPQALKLFQQALILARGLGNLFLGTQILCSMGDIAVDQGSYSQAESLYIEALTLAQKLKNQTLELTVLNNLGAVASAQGDHAKVQAMCEQILVISRDLNHPLLEVTTLNNLGISILYQDDYVTAQNYLEQALTINRKMGNRVLEAGNLSNLARIAVHIRDYQKAQQYYQQALILYQQCGRQVGMIETLEHMAFLASCKDHVQAFACLYGATQIFREQLGIPPTPDQQSQWQTTLASVAVAFDPEPFKLAQQVGQGMSLEAAIAYALQEI